MHVLMISLDSTLATNPNGDSRARHLAYAERAGQLTVIVYTPLGCPARVTASDSLTILPTNSRRKALFLVDALRRSRGVKTPVDLITSQDPFTTGLTGLRLRRTFHAPLLVQNHSFFFGNPAWRAERPLRNGLFAQVGRFVVRRADFYRTVNQREREAYIAEGGSPDRVVALPLGTASARFADPVDPARLEALRAKLGLQPQHRVVLWVGYPVTVKRIPLLFRAFRLVADRVPQARLLIIGDPARSPDDLSALARDLGIADQVIMPGAVPHADLAPYYALTHVFAHTSAYEGVPRVLLEASAAGLALVGMRVAGVEEVIEDDVNGYLVPDGDAHQFADRVVHLLTHPDDARRLGENARRIALDRYSADAYLYAWVDVWKRAVDLGRRA